MTSRASAVQHVLAFTSNAWRIGSRSTTNFANRKYIVKKFLSSHIASTGTNVRDVVIVGSGPAGYTAGLYAARSLLKPLILAGTSHGGQLMLTSDVENFPGVGSEPVAGPTLMNDLRVQAESQGAEVLERDVEKLDLSIYPFELEVAGIEQNIVAKAIIIATGAQALWLNAENEEKVRGRGVSTCATCDVS